ncbi:uncharacterized protein B0P05DRAFT_181945 [Gilbertella persicaria]|uniref:uncharacterized protein n=1 Tax=Gilbertella persicaria TaxID=101096 RepID=UPI00221E5883|nr:uncharacterized protein B0P05DRAFT_181945 [Gilbertella persicaria]KAI8071179.1 hypothetical protein B0P05DRAFT_181945 [Gilbertella persicaria]
MCCKEKKKRLIISRRLIFFFCVFFHSQTVHTHTFNITLLGHEYLMSWLFKHSVFRHHNHVKQIVLGTLLP